MFQFLRCIALIAAMMLSCGFALAQDSSSANFMTSACRGWLDKHSRPTLTEAMNGGVRPQAYRAGQRT
jgi:hypothetical protein